MEAGLALIILIFIVVAIVGVAVPLWALIDAAQRPEPAFQAVGQNKTMWLALIAGGWLACLVVGIVAGAIYLTNIRPQVMANQDGPFGQSW